MNCADIGLFGMCKTLEERIKCLQEDNAALRKRMSKLEEKLICIEQGEKDDKRSV